MKKRYAISVRGEVQGVMFRHAARRMAEGLRLSGFVRNDADGSVYVEAEGESGPLTAFMEWCHRGPDMARVTGVVTAEIPPSGDSDFNIV
jgi:acylphosphatase